MAEHNEIANGLGLTIGQLLAHVTAFRADLSDQRATLLQLDTRIGETARDAATRLDRIEAALDVLEDSLTALQGSDARLVAEVVKRQRTLLDPITTAVTTQPGSFILGGVLSVLLFVAPATAAQWIGRLLGVLP